jgi:uncharacterized protein YndB with AHSA1/START domain
MSDRTSSLHDGTIEHTATGGVIRFERRLEYGVNDVWDAITNPQRLAEWWLPFEADITIDLRTGGEMTFVGTGKEPLELTCTILRVDPPTLLEHTHVDPGSIMRWELDPVDAGCVLRLSHFVSDVPAAVEKGYVVGLHTSLSRLAPCLAGEPRPWDWDEFAEAQARYADLGLAGSAS